MTAHDSAPLRGVRILDLTTVIMGPLATRILGDLGADVIRVEIEGADVSRTLGAQRNDGMTGLFLGCNRNKRSVRLDIKTDAGREAALRIAATCDVFVSNIRTAALDRAGLSEQAVRAVRPDVVYCIANGFGSDGPYADRTAYDDVIQAASGLASISTWFDKPPSFFPTLLGDKIGALHIVYSVLAALFQRTKTGTGTHVEVPMAECLTAFNLVEHMMGHTFEPKVGRFSYPRMRTPNRRPRRTADGWACLMPYTWKNYVDFFRLAGRPELADDTRFESPQGRTEHVEELYDLVDELAPSHTTAEWLQLCEQFSIPASAVVDLEHVDDDPHFAAVELVQLADHPTEGRYRFVRDPIRFGHKRSTTITRHAPRFGEHTREVLLEVGMTDEAIDRLS